jgi:ABC-type lipoprotein release transport system permease subunit
MVLGLTVDGVAAIAALVAIGLLVVGLVIAFVVKAIVLKVIGLVVTILLALLLWSQRTSMKDCADNVKEQVRANATANVDTTCSFFGRDVSVKLPTRP